VSCAAQLHQTEPGPGSPSRLCVSELQEAEFYLGSQKPEGSSPRSQETVSGLCHEPCESSPHIHPSYSFKIHFNIILLPSSTSYFVAFLLHAVLPIFCTPFSSLSLELHSQHILLDMIMILCKKCKIMKLIVK
jgi:hypothetical protein